MGVSLDVQPGEFMTLVGPSDCGRYTILRIIAGLLEQDAGRILIDGHCVDDLAPKARDVATVFQSYALYPHMSVAQNIAIPLEAERLSLGGRLSGRLWPGSGPARQQISAEVASVAEQVELSQLLRRRQRPRQPEAPPPATSPRGDAGLGPCHTLDLAADLSDGAVLPGGDLAAIPQDLYDAASVDGMDHPLDRFFPISLPMPAPTTVFIVITSTITAFKIFYTVAVSRAALRAAARMYCSTPPVSKVLNTCAWVWRRR